MTTTERAALLGTEHGTAATETWIVAAEQWGSIYAMDRPQPDLTDDLGWRTKYLADEETDAYEAAFIAAVEATIRAKVTA